MPRMLPCLLAVLMLSLGPSPAARTQAVTAAEQDRQAIRTLSDEPFTPNTEVAMNPWRATTIPLIALTLVFPNALQAQSAYRADFYGYTDVSTVAWQPIARGDSVGIVLRSRLEHILDHWGGPGAVVILVKDGAVLYADGFGTTTAGGKTHIDPHTLVSVQSVTKPFTAVALGLLVDEEKIAWDDPVQEHLPEFSFGGPYVSSHITLRDLISHRSSLPLFMGSGPFGEDSISDILTHLSNEESQMGFREGVAYSNVGMALLGEIIARSTGTSWQAFVSSRILKPLGMSASYASARELERVHGDLSQVPDLMKPVDRADSGLVDSPWRHWNPPYCPAACIVTTGADMVRFMQFLLNEGVIDGRSLLRAASLREMWTPHGVRAFAVIADYEPFINPFAGGISYGLGFYIHEYRGRVVVEHVGSGGGSSALALIPSAQIGVFVSTNADYHLASDRMVSALKFAAIDYALGLPPTDWIALLHTEEE